MSESRTVLGNGLKLAGEAVLPGASEMIEGHIKSGLLHSVLAVGAASLLAGTPILAGLAVLAIKANSYSRAVTGDNLIGGMLGGPASGGTRPR
jgi:hypothetical protein